MPVNPLRVFALVLLMVSGATALAGGLYIGEFGHPLQGASNAGANAYANDASTAFANPAGIMRLDDSEVMATLIGIYSKIEFEAEPGTTVSGNDGGDAGGFLPGAAVFYANPLSDKWGFGFSLNAISGAALDHDTGFVGRYWAQEVELMLIDAMPSVAYRISDNWSVSIGLPMSYGLLDMDVAIPPLTMLGMNDGQAKISDGNDFHVNIGASVLWEVTDRFRLGLAYFGEQELEFDSDLQITLPPGGGTTLPQVAADVAITFPQTLRLSGASEIGARLTVLATVAWEDWSEMNNVLINTSLGGGALPRNWDDTWHFGIGLEWATDGPWTYHTGIAYDTDPTSADKRTADMPVDEQIRLSGGANYRFENGNSLGGVLTIGDLGDARIENGGAWGDVVGEYDSNYALFFGLNYTWR